MSDEQTAEQQVSREPSLAQQLSGDLDFLDGVLNVGLGAGLAKGDISRVQVAEAHNAFHRTVENCKQLVQDNIRMANSARGDEKTQQQINALEAELGQLRIFKRKTEQAAKQAEAQAAAKPKQPRAKKSRGKPPAETAGK